jgi:hypothetical protein
MRRAVQNTMRDGHIKAMMRAKSRILLAAGVLVATGAALRAQEQPQSQAQVVAVPGGSFEDAPWTIADAMSAVSGEQAAQGKNSLKVVDDSETQGSDASSPLVPVRAGRWKLRGMAWPVSGVGLGIYVRLLGADGKLVAPQDEWQRAAPSAPVGQWSPWNLNFDVPPEATHAQVWIHSYGKARVSAFLDEITLEYGGRGPTAPPWIGQYKIKASEKVKLTRADVVGPDGLVYPDWRHAGIPGGIPQVRVRARATDFGAIAGDDRDDADALERGLEEVGRRGGGALLLEAGRYILQRPILVARDGVVLRGAGQGKTKIDFVYQLAPRTVKFFNVRAGAAISNSDWFEAHAGHAGLEKLELFMDGQRLAVTEKRGKEAHWGGTFSVKSSGGAALAKADATKETHELKAIATFEGGASAEQVLAVRVDRNSKTAARIPSHLGAIMFAGVGKTGPEEKLARDGLRGDVQVLVAATSTLKVGDRLLLRAPATPRWNALVRNECPWGEYRRNEFEVMAAAPAPGGVLLTLNQPLRIDFPTVDGSYVQKILPIRACGVEDLTLEQTGDPWTSGVIFSNAWECWAQRVHVIKPGRWPVYFTPAKRCEIRDSRFDDAWWKGGGGTAYVGWEVAYDCIMDGVRTSKLRHAPLVQWSAAGNVIRNGVFEDSDGQWHSGWTHENLFENCVINSKVGNGSYGYGLWGSPPEDEAHGPNGPRNVVYNCDITSERAGLWMGGSNEGWMILHNRFDVQKGVGVFAKDASFDHTIAGNTFVLRDATASALHLAREDCIGVELLNNRILGGASTWKGRAPLIEKDNVRVALGNATNEAARPRPAVASILEWQRARR